jgi:aerotaxis receptor
MTSIYGDRTVPLAQLFDINDRMKGNSIALYDALAKSRAGKPPGDVVGIVTGNIEAISRKWTEYMATYLTPEEKAVADDFASKPRTTSRRH